MRDQEFCVKCGKPLGEQDAFCAKCGHPRGGPMLVAARQGGFPIWLVIIGAIVILLIIGWGVQQSEEQKLTPEFKAAAIAAVRNHWQANAAMLALNPDMDSASWTVHPNNETLYGRCKGICAEVWLSLSVMPGGATEAKSMGFEWRYDVGQPADANSIPAPLNTETRTYFVQD